MKISLLICLLISFTACKHKAQPVPVSGIPIDSLAPVTDTAIIPYTPADHIKDSLQRAHELDSFNAIKPQAVFISDEKVNAFRKMIATAIDTTGVTVIPTLFSDTSIIKYDKDQNPVSSRQICKNNRFTIVLFDQDFNSYKPRKLFINGKELRAGIEIDTSISGTFYSDNIEINGGDCALMKFGTKEYLLITGSFQNCTGTACGISYYLLYDPVIKKAMLLQQFRSEFIAGYDKRYNSLVFIDMIENAGYNYLYQCFMFSGKIYRFEHSGKIKRMLNNTGEQFHFTAFSRQGDDTISLIGGNLPVKK